jgi:hypothetical protein
MFDPASSPYAIRKGDKLLYAPARRAEHAPVRAVAPANRPLFAGTRVGKLDASRDTLQ